MKFTGDELITVLACLRIAEAESEQIIQKTDLSAAQREQLQALMRDARRIGDRIAGSVLVMDEECPNCSPGKSCGQHQAIMEGI